MRVCADTVVAKIILKQFACPAGDAAGNQQTLNERLTFNIFSSQPLQFGQSPNSMVISAGRPIKNKRATAVYAEIKASSLPSRDLILQCMDEKKPISVYRTKADERPEPQKMEKEETCILMLGDEVNIRDSQFEVVAIEWVRRVVPVTAVTLWYIRAVNV